MAKSDTQRRLLLGCDESQVLAITTADSPLLVIAGAGSGKTRVLTHRIAWRVGEGSASPAHVLALTFTRKAAGELRARLTGIGLPGPVTAGTFHAVALGELRRRAVDEGRTLPVVLDSKVRILRDVLPDKVRPPGTARFERQELLSLIATEIEWSKARGIGTLDYAFQASRQRRQPGLDLEMIGSFYASYEQEKAKRRVLDFDDLLDRLASEIETNPNFAAVERWRFRHLFVDELQDANRAQLRLLNALYGPESDLFAVGDARQAIYGWNGADSSAVTDFSSRYLDATIIELTTNYRSTPEVVAFASAALDSIDTSHTEVVRSGGRAPTIICYESDVDETIGVAEAIRHQHRVGRRWSDIAILARTNALLGPFEDALTSIGIPTRGTTTSLIDRPVGRDAFAGLCREKSTVRFLAALADLEESLSELRPSGSPLDTGVLDDRVFDAGSSSEDLAALVRLGREYAAFDPVPNGEGFFTYLRSDRPQASGDAVDLVTFHRAKGLEWKVVFVVGLEEGLVPISHARDKASKDEERRLLYVALSRAADEIYCSYASTRRFAKSIQRREPSPFIATLDIARAAISPGAGAPIDSALESIEKSRRLLRGST